MLTRILFGYSVSLLPLIILLPIEGVLYTSIGHNAVRDIEAVVGPEGYFSGLSYPTGYGGSQPRRLSSGRIVAFVAFVA